MFDAMAEWMTIPLLNQEGGKPFKRIGLAHPTIAPYGVFKTRDGADILISIQNDREWRVLAEKVLGDAALGTDPNFATNPERNEHRARNRRHGRDSLSRSYDVEPLMEKLAAADIAFARRQRFSAVGKAIRICGASPSARRAGRRACRRRRRSGPSEPRALRPGARARRAHRDDQEGIRTPAMRI